MLIKRFKTPDELTLAAADLLCACILREECRVYPSAIMLSGGRTPLAAYREVARRGIVAPATLHFLFIDERMVPPDSPESNYGNAEPMLRAIAVDHARVMRVQTERPLHEAADAYDQRLELFVKDGRVLVGLLGLGADGHTASLFSQGDLDRAQDRHAIAVPHVPAPDRVTVTPRLLSLAETIVFLVAGNDKASIVADLIQSPESVVAGRAVKGVRRTELWTAT